MAYSKEEKKRLDVFITRYGRLQARIQMYYCHEKITTEQYYRFSSMAHKVVLKHY